MISSLRGFAALLVSLTLCATTVHAADGKTALTAYAERVAAPAFDLADPDGKRYRLSDYAGKVLVVNFWATWCPPCRKEMPSMQSLWNQLQPEGVELIAIDFGESANDVTAFAATTGIELPLLLDPTGAVVHQFEAGGLPATYIVDKQGRLAYKAAGERDWDSSEIIKVLRALAGEPTS